MSELTTYFLLFGLACGALALFSSSGLLEALTAATIASSLTATGLHFQVLPEEFNVAALSFVLLTIVISILIWKPLRNFTMARPETERPSELAGVRLLLPSDFSEDHPFVDYSGVRWAVRGDISQLQPSQEVIVSRAAVGELWLEPAPDSKT